MVPIIGFAAEPMSAIKIQDTAVNVLRKHQPSALLLPEAIKIEWLVEQVLTDSRFCLEIKPDNYFPSDAEAVTDFQERRVYLRKSTYCKLETDDGRARFTLAHECGHVVLHTDQWLHKLAIAARPIDLTAVKPFVSPEWQANKFAAVLLMPEQTFWPAYCTIKDELYGFESVIAQELARMFKVSRQATEKRILFLEDKNKKGSLMA